MGKMAALLDVVRKVKESNLANNSFLFESPLNTTYSPFCHNCIDKAKFWTKFQLEISEYLEKPFGFKFYTVILCHYGAGLVKIQMLLLPSNE